MLTRYRIPHTDTQADTRTGFKTIFALLNWKELEGKQVFWITPEWRPKSLPVTDLPLLSLPGMGGCF